MKLLYTYCATARILQDSGTIILGLTCWTLVIIIKSQSRNCCNLFRM